MPYRTILLSTLGAVSTITLNRPDKLNAFTAEMHAELADALGVVQSSGARVLVLTGAGRGFCAGQDLAERKRDARPDLGETLAKLYNPLIRHLRAMEIPILAAVNGVAAGAGMSLALAADITIAARSASFLQAFARIGLQPDAGSTWMLPRLVGPARARGLAMLAEKISAEQAEAWGLIWKVVDDAQLAAEVATLSERLASAAPLAIAHIKRALDLAWENSLDGQLELERMNQAALGRSDDYREGVAAFLEKRPARFTGR